MEPKNYLLLLFLCSSAYASGTTFQACDKTPEQIVPSNFLDAYGSGNKSSHHLVKYLKEYHAARCTRVLQGTDYGEDRVEPAGKHGFISTVLQAYRSHHNLVIRPDDIWIAILSQFSLYISGNPEKLRDRFVNFDGKMRLVVNMKGKLDAVSYGKLVELMTDQIHNNIVDKEVRDWIMPNFTTTTRDDKVAAGIVLMATLKPYFEYVAKFLCGIPQITLEGTEADWRNLAARLDKLRSYEELESWVDDMLAPILEQFIAAKLGRVDEEFWSSIVIVGGCAGDQVNGWITAFSVFGSDGKWQAGNRVKSGRKWPTLNIKRLVSDVVTADIVICDHGVRHDAVAFAGHLGQQILPDGYTLKPRIGWAIALKNETTVGRTLLSPVPKQNTGLCANN